MKQLLVVASLCSLLFIACEIKSKRIFWISEPDGQKNDLLSMAESTNIPEITLDSLAYYLTQEELVSAEKLTFKNFGKIHSDPNFDVYVLLKKGSETGRDYTFIIRTFGKKRHLISSCELARWNETENMYCYGSIDENLIIRKTCDNRDNIEFKQILQDGRIVVSSFYWGD